jgi:hypothetical protein
MEDDKQAKPLPTLDELMRMGKGVEIYDGEFRYKYGENAETEASTGVAQHVIVRNIYRLLHPYMQAKALVVKVVCPSDRAIDVQQQIQTYLVNGVEQVWVVFPRLTELHQYRRSQPDLVRRYVGSTTLDVSDLFPDLTLTTDAIFALPGWANPTTDS